MICQKFFLPLKPHLFTRTPRLTPAATFGKFTCPDFFRATPNILRSSITRMEANLRWSVSFKWYFAELP